ncbi:HD domain-containing phosphohydrolase, partial [Methylobacter sp.]|uniref:HD domain-containing phosphohydrolase n=1 Tax=Methylobacter sp. TaxID=2051955 RepID=UPI0025EED82B
MTTQKITTTGKELSSELQKIICQVEKLTEIGIALSAEKDTTKLLEKILIGAKSITNSDGGTIYQVVDNTIKIEIIHSDSLGISLGGGGNVINIPNIPLYDENGEPNLKNVVCYSYHNNKTINIDDAYDAVHFDFSGTKAFDKKNNYRSKSFLSIPLTNHQGEIIGILQLINAIDPETQKIIEFDAVSQRFAEALASQAATVLTKQQLIIELENMFESLVKLIATAVDEKSPYTGGHCRRVPELVSMLTEAAHDTDHGYLQNFRLNDADRYELSIASWLHDCGKIITPEYVIDKATKLEAIFDRIHLVETRFEILKRDQEIAYLRRQLADQQKSKTSSAIYLDGAVADDCMDAGGTTPRTGEVELRLEQQSRATQGAVAEVEQCREQLLRAPTVGALDDAGAIADDCMDAGGRATQGAVAEKQSRQLEQTFQASIRQLNDDLAFIRCCNTGGEIMSDEDIARIQSLKHLTWSLNDVDTPLLSDEEVYNLSIFRGTLTAEERKIINNHINVTISMLQAIKFPKHLQNVVEIAGGHHERMDGKG